MNVSMNGSGHVSVSVSVNTNLFLCMISSLHLPLYDKDFLADPQTRNI